MARWWRVFGTIETGPEPAAVLQRLYDLRLPVRGNFHGDDRGWFRAELCLNGEEPVHLERYLADEEGIRAELNTWAAWLEAQADARRSGWLMVQMIGTRQLFTLQAPAGVQSDGFCQAVCQV